MIGDSRGGWGGIWGGEVGGTQAKRERGSGDEMSAGQGLVTHLGPLRWDDGRYGRWYSRYI